jgi:hypothetical protein
VYRPIDLREQVVSVAPQPVITEDNLVVEIDTVLYFQVTDPRSAAYEIASYLQTVEQLTVTTLRNVVGSMDLERTLTSRDSINSQLRKVLDDATGKWGLRVNRVEIKAIDPPTSIKDAMEKQMRAERDKRAAILSTEGQRQSQIPRRCRASPAPSPRRCRQSRAPPAAPTPPTSWPQGRPRMPPAPLKPPLRRWPTPPRSTAFAELPPTAPGTRPLPMGSGNRTGGPRHRLVSTTMALASRPGLTHVSQVAEET